MRKKIYWVLITCIEAQLELIMPSLWLRNYFDFLRLLYNKITLALVSNLHLRNILRQNFLCSLPQVFVYYYVCDVCVHSFMRDGNRALGNLSSYNSQCNLRIMPSLWLRQGLVLILGLSYFC